MAMRTASPWWLSALFGLGLVCTLVGERLLSQESGVHMLLSGILGVGLLIVVTVARGWTTMSSTSSRQRVERTLLICHLGTLLALVVYALSTDWGMGLLKIKDTAKFSGALTVLYGILLLLSIVPVLMIELSLGTALRTSFEIGADQTESSVEHLRVREVGWSGLTVALAVSLLMVTCQVSKERNVQRDVSYFKTSSPGDSTKNIVAASTEPVRVMLFFPPSNEVKEQVQGYFEALRSASGKIEISNHDRVVEAELAGKYKAKDGAVVLARGTGDKEKFFTIELETEIEKARKGAGKLRNFDREVNSNLLKLVREKRKAYVTTGHGELTNPDSVPAEVKARRVLPELRTSVFKKRLGDLNYEVKDLGLLDLAKDVPDDATIVIAFGPTTPFQPAEWDALGRYLDRGGRLMIALDPVGVQTLGSLEGRLGLRMVPGSVTDDKDFLPQRGVVSDRQFTITSQFSAHASTTSLSRSVGKGLILIDAGALEEIPFTTKTQPTRTVTIRSGESSWVDVADSNNNKNFVFDVASEKRQRWPVGAAVEGPKEGTKDGYRAIVFSDADLFVDVPVQNALGRVQLVMVSGPLLDDTIKWLGGEETFVGEVVSEDDKAVQHTKNQDAYWFATMIIGAPLLVLMLGLVGTWARRRRPKKAEVTP